MSAIEKLDSVLAKWHENAEDNAAYGELLQAGKAVAYEDCADDLDALMPAIRQDMIDARRYRWLRDPNRRIGSVIDKVTGHLESGFPIYEYRAGEELDAAIDARLASDSEGGE